MTGDRRTIHPVGRVVAGFLIGCITLYQRLLSPLFPSSCIYTPTCSRYAVEAIRKHGPLKGVLMACGRLARCTPFHKGGHDPVS